MDFIENNKIIAEYDGWIPKSTNEEKNETKYVKKHPEKSGYIILKAEKFLYHTSWNWLMPVLVRIMEKISSDGGYIILKEKSVEINQKTFEAESFKLAVYKAIVEQIKSNNFKFK